MSQTPYLGHKQSADALSILSESVINRYQTNTLLIKEGEKSDRIWIILKGKCSGFKVVTNTKLKFKRPESKRKAVS